MISRLIDKITDKKAPIVVGLDPNLKFVPEKLKRASERTAPSDRSISPPTA